MKPDRLLKLAEAQMLVGVSRTTLWRWHNERGLKIYRVGNVTRIRESELLAFLARHELSSNTGATAPTSLADARH